MTRKLSKDDKLIVSRARKVQKFLSQPLNVAETFTGMKGKFASLNDTIKTFKELINGKYDHILENAFFMVCDINDVLKKNKKLKLK